MSLRHVKGPVWMIDSPFHGQRNILGTYVIKGEEVMVIDPGPASMLPGVFEGLRELEVRDVSMIAPSHIHLDHAGGSWLLMERHPEAVLYVHPRGAQHMVSPERLEAAARQLFGDLVDGYGEIRGIPMGRVVESRDGEALDLGGVSVNVIWTPGHSSHSQCYFEPENRVLVLGDSGGNYHSETGAITPTTPPPFNPVKAVESLDKLIALEPETVCYGHFGFADGGVEKLESFKRQIRLWTEMATEGVNEGLGYRGVYDRLRKVDPMIEGALRSGGESEENIVADVVGFVEYVKWVQKQG